MSSVSLLMDSCADIPEEMRKKVNIHRRQAILRHLVTMTSPGIQGRPAGLPFYRVK